MCELERLTSVRNFQPHILRSPLDVANSCERAFAVDGLQFTSKVYTRDTSLRAFVLTQISGPALVGNSQGADVVIGKDGKGGKCFRPASGQT